MIKEKILGGHTMKKHGILNSDIAKVLADLGHTDQIVIADCGLPVPSGVKKIDLALIQGVPTFEEVVRAVYDDMVVEKIIVAKEMNDKNVKTKDFLDVLFLGVEMEEVSHEKLKELTKNAKAIIRTGETTPYANCILQSNVFF